MSNLTFNVRFLQSLHTVFDRSKSNEFGPRGGGPIGVRCAFQSVGPKSVCFFTICSIGWQHKHKFIPDGCVLVRGVVEDGKRDSLEVDRERDRER